MQKDATYKAVPNTGDHRCFGCSPLNPSGLQMQVHADEKSVLSWVTVPEHLCGWRNLVHGGVISTILDEVMGWGVIVLLKRISLTQSMTIDFLRPVTTGVPLKTEAKVLERTKEHEAVLESTLYDQQEEPCATARGTFALLSPRLAKRMGILDEELLEAFRPLLE